MVGVMLDVTERRRWEQRLAILVAELQLPPSPEQVDD